MSATLPALRNRVATLSLVALWRALAVLAAAAAILLFVSSRLVAQPEPARIRHAMLLYAALGALAVLLLLLPRRLLTPALGKERGVDVAESPWLAAVLLTGAIAVVGILAVGFLALYPPPVASSAYKAWDYLDKRWIAASYLLGIVVIFLPGLCRRAIEVMSGAGSRHIVSDAPRLAADAATGAVSAIWRRALLAALVGSLLAVVYVAPLISRTLGRTLDSHELVHLGGFQSIKQGGLPFIDARTQYGPGQQIVSYELMQATEFTVRGARLAHLLINLATIAVFFGVTLFGFGWAVGGAVILVALFISPLQVTTMVGWGLLERWMAPYLVGVLAPMILWSGMRVSRQRLALAVLGIGCGVLAWMSQENASTSVITLALVMSGAVMWRRTSARDALLGGAVYVAAMVTTLLVLLAALVGPGHLGQALALYRSGSGLVFAGITNTPWSPANTYLTAPGLERGAAEHLIGWKLSQLIYGWRAAYYFTPLVIAVTAALCLYLPRRDERSGSDLRSAQLLGVIAAAVPLHLLNFFRADSTHFVGTSTALAALMVLSVVAIPMRLPVGTKLRALAGVALAIGFFLAYPFLSTRTEFSFREAANPARTLDGVRLITGAWGSSRTATASRTGGLLERRLGYVPKLDESCCRSNKLSYAQLGDAMKDINAATAGRSVVVDSKKNYSPIGTVASAVYFLADLRVGTRYVEPMMSIWTDADIAAAKQDLLDLRPECLVTGGPDFHLTTFALEHFGSYTTHTLPGPTQTVVYCRSAAPRAGE